VKLRNTVNGQVARTLRDASRDPYDWIEHHRSPVAGVVFVFRAWLVLVGIVVGTVWMAVRGK
jgi:hypothetical protein